ncbi:MAG TPA: PPC domain-containing protein [Candidatus Acidoferrum sp.]|nr:PPC domain-containing protein [Candidatus Acidoferrum sp.]
MSLWLSVPGQAALVGPGPGEKEVTFRVMLEAGAAGVCWARVVSSNGVSNVRGFVIDDSGSVAGSRTNRSRATAQSLVLPCAVEGVTEELAVSWWNLSAKKNERVSIEVTAMRLGSRMDSFLRVLDMKGSEVISNDDAPGLRGDSALTFTAKEAGDYFVELRDINYAAGRDYFYRLRVSRELLSRNVSIASSHPVIAEREPNGTTKLATEITLPCGIDGRFDASGDLDVFKFSAQSKQAIQFLARTRSINSGCDVSLRIENSRGELLAKSNVSAADEGVVRHTFAADGEYRLLVNEANGASGPPAFYRIEAREAPEFTLSVDVEKVEAPFNGSFQLKVNCARGGFKDPIFVSVPDFPALTVASNVIPRGATNVTVKVSLSPNLRTGTAHRFQVVGMAASRSNAPVVANTTAAWQKGFPQMLHVPAPLESFITLGVTSAAADK